MGTAIKRLLVLGSTIGFGATLLWILNNIFDWVLYPFVICSMGIMWGGIVMSLLAIPFNYLLIKGYDLIGRDLLGLETLKEFQETEQKGRLGKVIRVILGKGRIGTFVFISLYDPIPATLYMRSGTKTYHGLKGLDWMWFAISNMIANISWIVLVGGGIVIIDATTGACGF